MNNWREVLGWKGVNIDSDKPRKGYIYEINGALFGIEGYGVNYSSNLYTKAYLVKLLKGPYEEWIEGMKYWVNEDFFNNATQKNILNSIDPDEVINVYEATINRMEEEGVEEDLEKSALDNTAQYFGVSSFEIQEILDKYNS